MNIKTLINPRFVLLTLAYLLAIFFTSMVFNSPAGALECNNGTVIDDPIISLPNNGETLSNSDRDTIRENACSEFGGYSSANIGNGGVSRDELAGDSETNCQPGDGVELSAENCGIISIVVNVINFLSAVAGIAIVASLMISGYTYMTAQDNAGQIEKAKSRIIQTLLALALFIFMYALLNFLIPGGLGLS